MTLYGRSGERRLAPRIAPARPSLAGQHVTGTIDRNRPADAGQRIDGMDLDPIVDAVAILPPRLRHRPRRTTVQLPEPVTDSRVTVVIPTKDEEGLIGEIVDVGAAVRRRGARRRRPLARSDARRSPLEHGARVIQDNGHGKGEALRLSFDAATTDIVVFIDADGSHDPHGHSRAGRADQGRTRPTWSSARAARAAATSCTARSSSSSATSDRS